MPLFLQGETVHSLLTGANLHFAKIHTYGTGAPVVPPTYVGETYYDITNAVFYVGVGISSVADWSTQSFQDTIIIVGPGIIPSGAFRVIVYVDTTSIPITLTMPPHKDELIVTIIDFNRNSFTNNITLLPNSGIGTIDKSASPYIIDSNGASVSFISQQSISNWAIIS